MDVLVSGAGGMRGEVTPPPSKSYTHRAIAAASLSDRTVIRNPSLSEANTDMRRACEQMGAGIATTEDGGYDVRGFGCREPSGRVWVGNSGTALRLAVSLAGVVGGTRVIDGDASLRRRPTGALIRALNALGGDARGTPGGGEEYAPITVTGGRLSGGSVEIDGTKSSQYISSLLLASPLADSDVEIRIAGDVVSRPYIEMTRRVMGSFGVSVDSPDGRRYRVPSGQRYASPGAYEIPPDYSQAAFFLAAACLVESDVTVRGLVPDNAQADERIVQILSDMGAVIEGEGDRLRVRGPFELAGAEIDLRESPDLFPVLAVLGAYAEGSTRLHNMPQIRYKETDRVAVVSRELRKYGVRVDDAAEDEMTVYHADMPERRYDFDARGGHGVTDHRVAMALSLVGIRSGSAVIRDAGRIGISYPDYLEHLGSVGVKSEVVAGGGGAG